MSHVKVPDEKGCTLTMNFFNGRYYPAIFSEEALTNMSDFPLREDDVLLCSYPKSGCHWIWEIILVLLNGEISLDVKSRKEDFMMELRSSGNLSSLPSPRVLNNHLLFDSQPRDLLVKKPKVVFIYRNFKDQALSYFYHHRGLGQFEYNGDFLGYLPLLVSGKISSSTPFEYIKNWEEGIANNPELPVFITSYEDLKKNGLSEVRRLSKFLGKDYSDEFLHQVCDVTSFDKMKQLKADSSVKGKDGEPIMYRKGQVGEWKNYFTVALNEWFDEIIQRETAGSKLKFKYTI